MQSSTITPYRQPAKSVYRLDLSLPAERRGAFNDYARAAIRAMQRGDRMRATYFGELAARVAGGER